MQKTLRIFLLILIIIGIILLFTQKIWVPKLVDRILLSENTQQQISKTTTTVSNESIKTNIIRLNTPIPNQIIQSPLVIKGEARGSWFFEASFPVVLTNWDGLIIAQGIAKAKSNWMTSDFVPFEAILTFSIDKKTYNNKGTLILKKNNPSGLPKNDNSFEIPIIFAGVVGNIIPTPSECIKDSDCSNGASCLVEGPLIADQPVHKVCVPKGQVVPF